jgi:undecaprenyl-diphosphatase
LPALVQRLVLTGALAGAFVGFTGYVATGGMNVTDHQVLSAMSAIWMPALKPLMLAIAFLGGLEVSTLAAGGLAVYLWRFGFRSDVAALLVLPLGIVLEVVYKRLLVHPPVPPSISKGDAPSFSELIEHATGGNSYPSGHMLRTVIVYGLMAFVIYRLASRAWLRIAAVLVALILVVLMAFDRLYLEVHWESDVIGALLLGAVCLLAATLWLDRPRPA